MIFNNILATAKRNLIMQTRAYPIGFFVGKLLSCFFTILGSYFIFNIVFKGNVSDEFIKYSSTSDYMSFVILGTFMYLFVEGTFLNVSRSFITEMREGTLDSLLISPINYMGYLSGNMLEQTMITAGELLIAMLITIPFDLKFANINTASTALCIAITLVALFGMSIILSGIMIYFRDTYLSQNTVFNIIYLTTGILFPIQYLPSWVQIISNCIPVTYSLRILRNSTLTGLDIASQARDFTLLAVLSIIYFAVGVLLIKRIVKKAPERQFI
jgi:ABC-2 type transport system permease protein